MPTPPDVPAPMMSPGCSVTSDGQNATIACSDGSRAQIPISALDGGQSCEIHEQEDGNISISCPDGTQGTVPGAGVAESSLKLVAATAASCGGCHDSNAARAHFSVMTAQGESGPSETCGTCHGEGSIKPVSQVHARPELGPPGLRVLITDAHIDTDTRNGFRAVRVKYDIDADADADDIAAIVAQSQKRSAVFDIITNPTNVFVTVK